MGRWKPPCEGSVMTFVTVEQINVNFQDCTAKNVHRDTWLYFYNTRHAAGQVAFLRFNKSQSTKHTNKTIVLLKKGPERLCMVLFNLQERTKGKNQMVKIYQWPKRQNRRLLGTSAERWIIFVLKSQFERMQLPNCLSSHFYSSLNHQLTNLHSLI